MIGSVSSETPRPSRNPWETTSVGERSSASSDLNHRPWATDVWCRVPYPSLTAWVDIWRGPSGKAKRTFVV